MVSAYPTCGSCRKKIYRDYGDALVIAMNASSKRGTTLRVYPCPTHDGFHLTKVREWVPRAVSA